MKNVISLIIAVLLIGCTVPEVVSQPDGTAVTNQVPSPQLTDTLTTIGAINDVSAPVNPYAGLIKILIGVVSTGAAAWASIMTWYNNRNKKLLKVVVQGVEQSKSAEAKSAIEAHSANAGVKLELDSAVQEIVTGNR